MKARVAGIAVVLLFAASGAWAQEDCARVCDGLITGVTLLGQCSGEIASNVNPNDPRVKACRECRDRMCGEAPSEGAKIIAPAKGDPTPLGEEFTIRWSKGTGIKEYQVLVGWSRGGGDIYSGPRTKAEFVTVKIPKMQKGTIHISLFSFGNDGKQYFDSGHYQAIGPGDLAFKMIPDVTLAAVRSLGKMSVPTLGQCEAECRKRGGCTAFTAAKAPYPQGGHYCELMSGYAQMLPNNCCVSGIQEGRTAAAQPPGGTIVRPPSRPPPVTAPPLITPSPPAATPPVTAPPARPAPPPVITAPPPSAPVVTPPSPVPAPAPGIIPQPVPPPLVSLVGTWIGLARCPQATDRPFTITITGQQANSVSAHLSDNSPLRGTHQQDQINLEAAWGQSWVGQIKPTEDGLRIAGSTYMNGQPTGCTFALSKRR